MSFFSRHRQEQEGGISLNRRPSILCQAVGLIALICLCCGAAAQSSVISTTESEPSRLASGNARDFSDKRPELNVCAFEWKPYSYLQGDKASGVLVDLVNAMELPYRIRFNFMPLPRCLAAVKQGQQDLILYSSTPDPDLVMASVPVQYHISGVIVKANSEHKRFTGLPQFSGKTLGVLRGNPIYKSLKHYQGVHWQLQNSGESMWKMLMRGRLDGAIGDYLSLTPLQVYRSGEVEFLRPALYATPIHMAVNRSVAETLIPLIDGHLKQLLEDGSVDHAYVKHGVEPFTIIRTMALDFERHQQEKLREAGAFVGHN